MRPSNSSPAFARYGRWLAAAWLVCAIAFGMAVDAIEIQDDKAVQAATGRYGQRGGQAVQAWLAFLRTAAGLPELEKIKAVNDFWNRHVMGREDIDNWKQTDYWATPVESLGKGAGDCEDYVIGKFFSLLALGVDPDKLRFVYVRAELGGARVAHMVLGYYPSPTAVPLVLDSLVPSVMKANERRDLTPVFSFNASGVFVDGQAAAPIDRVGRWRELMQRMQRDGINP